MDVSSVEDRRFHAAIIHHRIHLPRFAKNSPQEAALPGFGVVSGGGLCGSQQTRTERLSSPARGRSAVKVILSDLQNNHRS